PFVNARLQCLVVGVAYVDELEDRRRKPGIEPRDRRRPPRVRPKSGVEILAHDQIAVARVNVVGADRDVPGKLLFDTDARLARVRQMPVWIVEVHGPGVLLDGARRVELVHQRTIDDRTVDEERIGRHPPGGWTRINARGRWTDGRGAGAAEERRERVRQRA